MESIEGGAMTGVQMDASLRVAALLVLALVLR
jgi:hypothetical protein